MKVYRFPLRSPAERQLCLQVPAADQTHAIICDNGPEKETFSVEYSNYLTSVPDPIISQHWSECLHALRAAGCIRDHLDSKSGYVQVFKETDGAADCPRLGMLPSMFEGYDAKGWFQAYHCASHFVDLEPRCFEQHQILPCRVYPNGNIELIHIFSAIEERFDICTVFSKDEIYQAALRPDLVETVYQIGSAA